IERKKFKPSNGGGFNATPTRTKVKERGDIMKTKFQNSMVEGTRVKHEIFPQVNVATKTQ
ncbi:hypothetical protein, partial [Actinobacillus pleuropneumoniae]